jgi:N-acetylmuramoyl-L-alanine amidase
MPRRSVKPDIYQRPLSYTQRLESRCVEDINLVVIHCTELPDMEMARIWGEKILHPENRTGNSGHYYINRDGGIEQWVALDRVAHHVRGFNPKSIGIELVNSGRYPDWLKSDHQAMTEPYPDIQIMALVRLLDHLERRLPGLIHIAGHEDLDVEMLPSDDQPGFEIRRKVDPGPLFPWPVILNGVSLKQVTATDL